MDQVAFDRADAAIPYEERKIEDRELFSTFGHRVSKQLGSLVAAPLIEQFWPAVLTRARVTDNLGACLSQARHQCEIAWGLQTREVTQSRVCASESFQWLVAHLLAQLPRFRAVYNEAVYRYRRLHHLRRQPSWRPNWRKMVLGWKRRCGSGPATIRGDGVCSPGRTTAIWCWRIARVGRTGCRFPPTAMPRPRSPNSWNCAMQALRSVRGR